MSDFSWRPHRSCDRRITRHGRDRCAGAREGCAHIIALARTQGALEELDDAIRAMGGEATLTPCDIKDFDALDRLGRAIYERWGKLDILMATAGVLGPVTPLGHAEPRQWEDTFAVNVTANWRLIRSLDPLLRASRRRARCIYLFRRRPCGRFRPLLGTLRGIEGGARRLVRTYAAETKNITAVRVMAVNPGPLRTRMRASAMPGEDPMSLRTPEDLAPKIAALCGPNWTQTGKLYDFPQDRVLSFVAPG